MSKQQYYKFLSSPPNALPAKTVYKIDLGGECKDVSDSDTEIESVDTLDDITEADLALMDSVFNQVSLYIRQNNWLEARYLINQYNYGVNILDSDGNAPLHVAVMNSCFDAVIDLLNFNANPNLPNEEGERAIHIVAYNGGVDLLRILLDRGASLNLLDDNENNALHHATMNYDSLRAEETVEFLLSRGVNPDARNMQGNTALHNAADSGKVKVITSLLRMMPDENIQNDDGNTPLHIAAMNGNMDAVRLFVYYGANFTIINNAGVSAADFAATDEIRDFLYRALVEDLEMRGEALEELIYGDDEDMDAKESSDEVPVAVTPVTNISDGSVVMGGEDLYLMPGIIS